MKPVKLGIIGTGIAARDLHWPALKQIKDKFQIVAVCNRSEEKASKFSEKVGGAPFVLDYRELLAMPHVEAVDIVLPFDLNYQVTREALAAGKHVLVEKPLEANLEMAKKMLDLTGEFDRVMMVAEHFRYLPAFIQMKNYIQEGAIGTPYFVSWDIYSHMTFDNKYANTGWRINHTYPGGFITDGGIHNIAGLRFLLGDFQSGYAHVNQVNPKIGEIDTFSFIFRMNNNIQGTLNLLYTSIRHQDSALKIFGDQGTLLYIDNHVILKKKYEPEQDEYFVFTDGYRNEFVDFYEAVRNGRPVISTFGEAYRDLEVIIRALEGSKGDKVVKF